MVFYVRKKRSEVVFSEFLNFLQPYRVVIELLEREFHEFMPVVKKYLNYRNEALSVSFFSSLDGLLIDCCLRL